MNDTNDIPAFPNSRFSDVHGMTLRDYFASSILNGICSNQYYMTAIFEDYKLSDEKMKLKIAEICYEQADEMLKQRKANND